MPLREKIDKYLKTLKFSEWEMGGCFGFDDDLLHEGCESLKKGGCTGGKRVSHNDIINQILQMIEGELPKKKNVPDHPCNSPSGCLLPNYHYNKALADVGRMLGIKEMQKGK